MTDTENAATDSPERPIRDEDGVMHTFTVSLIEPA